MVIHYADLSGYPDDAATETICGATIAADEVVITGAEGPYWRASYLSSNLLTFDGRNALACVNCRGALIAAGEIPVESDEADDGRDLACGMPDRVWIGYEREAKTALLAFADERSAMSWASNATYSRVIVGPIAIPRDRTPRRVEVRPVYVEDAS